MGTRSLRTGRIKELGRWELIRRRGQRFGAREAYGHKKRTEWFLTLLDFEVDIAQGPDVVGGAFGGSVVGLADLEVWVLVA